MYPIHSKAASSQEYCKSVLQKQF